MNNKFDNYKFFLITNGILCILFVTVFKPISFETQGDAHAYIDLAKQIYNIGGAPTHDLSSRSPLYSIILGLFMLIFGQNAFIGAVVVFQYCLIFFTSIILYKLFFLLTGKLKIAFIAGTISSLNLSTIFYAYTIASETLSIFLFSFLVYMTINYFIKQRQKDLFIAGVLSALIVLARFNAIGIPLVLLFVLVMFTISMIKKKSKKYLTINFLIVILPVAIILNSWALYNFVNNGFYNIMPVHHTTQRWAIPSTINKTNFVSDKYQEVLNTFKANVEKQQRCKVVLQLKKGSLLENPFVKKISAFFSPDINGYTLYKDSEHQLLEYYHLNDTPEGIYQLGLNLMPFYDEIAQQNSKQLFKLRVYSFINTFKSISPLLPNRYNVNLNKLPSSAFVIYKLVFIFSMVFVSLFSTMHIMAMFAKKKLFSSIKWLAIYCFFWYFPLINFYANVLGDANRFKYPTESIVLALFVCYLFFIWEKINCKFKRSHYFNKNGRK